MREDIHPDQVRRLAPKEIFQFNCHLGVPCFNECCQDLELALTPYDVIRLSKNLSLSANDFLNNYCLIEQDDEKNIPQVYLGMIDDGRASCPFVTPDGCQVYADRPGACRTYPLGRAAFKTQYNAINDFHVLLSEPHCQGFSEQKSQDAEQWITTQGLPEYNAANDALLDLLYHPQMKVGLSPAQADVFLQTLYRQDEFRNLVMAKDFRSHTMPTPDELSTMAMDNTTLLNFAIRWLRHELFNE
ncbi:MAG: hypothetical protein A2511_14705 [Deltaproteobacteria bacterium RIFOXYD12_FULL_50_9]|nr:MAG: hypothetical protein A2511_14705 [Deltaproteobacteria bacterium RIFOXYD12_FULL_50_9]